MSGDPIGNVPRGDADDRDYIAEVLCAALEDAYEQLAAFGVDPALVRQIAPEVLLVAAAAHVSTESELLAHAREAWTTCAEEEREHAH